MRSVEIKAMRWGILFAFAAAACGGGDAGSSAGGAAQSAPAGGVAAAPADTMMHMPSWMQMDNAAKTIRIDITAGQSQVNNYWNFNGFTNGNATITVPEGYAVTINFVNRDPTMAHSLAVLSQVGNFPPAFENPTPVFAGAISPDALDVSKANPSGGTQTVSFTAATAGQYSLVCVIPAHATVGMWVKFNVSTDGSAGVQQHSM